MALLMSCAMPLAIWPERAQAFLLHDGLLGLAQIVVGLLQGVVELRLMRGQGHVFAQLPQELAFAAAEAVGFAARGDQHAEDLAFHQQRRGHDGTQTRRCASRCGKGNCTWLMSGS